VAVFELLIEWVSLMGSFSPNPLELNTLGAQGKNTNVATSSLSANYDSPSYDCDPTFDIDSNEGKVTEQYDWSVTSVQYKAVWFASPNNVAPYGSPPSNSFTASISPTQPSTQSGATLTFTPEITEYWAVSVSCEVTVTDNVTGQSWSGIGNAGFGTGNTGSGQLTGYILHIQYGGNIVDNQTQDVSVGEDIGLTADYGPSDMTLQWKIQGSIIDNYNADDSGGYIEPVYDFQYTSALMIYYWMDMGNGNTQNEQVTLTGSMPDGSNPSVNTTFNVYRPTWHYSTYYDSDGGIMLVSGEVYDGNPSSGTQDAPEYDPGIEFDYSVDTGTQFTTDATSQLSTVQICDNLTVTTVQDNLDSDSDTTTTFTYSLPAQLQGPLLDTSFPYPQSGALPTSPGTTFDCPFYTVDPPDNNQSSGSGFGDGVWATENVIVQESFTHDLLFFPNGGSNYAPLSQINWGWNAEAINGDFGFYLANSAKIPSNPPVGTDLSTLPVWNNNAMPSWAYPTWQH
jgi:hypothetical protein